MAFLPFAAAAQQPVGKIVETSADGPFVLGRADATLVELPECRLQRGRPQQAADMVGVEELHDNQRFRRR